MLTQRTYTHAEIQQLCNQYPYSDYDKFDSNRLGVNRNCGYGFHAESTDCVSYDLAKDIDRDLQFQHNKYKQFLPYYTAQFQTSLTGGGTPAPQSQTVTSDKSAEDYRKALTILEAIIAQEISPEIIRPQSLYDNRYIKRYINSISSSQSSTAYTDAYVKQLASVHVAILKRAYHQQVGTTPSHVLNLARGCFGNQSSIGHTKNKHLYYCFTRQNWVLETNFVLTFTVIDPDIDRLNFQQQLKCKTEAVLCKPIPLMETIELTQLMNNSASLVSYINNYKDGFKLQQIDFNGYEPYIKLFHDYATWNRATHTYFRTFITTPLKQYIDSKKAQSKASKLMHSTSGRIHGGIANTSHKTTKAKLTAAENLYNLLNGDFTKAIILNNGKETNQSLQDNIDFIFSTKHRKALCEGKLGRLVRNLSFIIGIKSPELYQALTFHVQNPLNSGKA